MSAETTRTSNGRDEQDRAGNATAYDARRARLEAHLVDVQRARRALTREGGRLPWLAIAAVLAVPVGWHWGAGAALFAVAAAVTLAVVGSYISWAHRQEYSDAEALIRQQLADLEHARTHGARRGPAWRVPGKARELFAR